MRPHSRGALTAGLTITVTKTAAQDHLLLDCSIIPIAKSQQQGRTYTGCDWHESWQISFCRRKFFSHR